MKCEKCGGLEIKVRETIYRKAEQTKGFRNKSSTPYVYRRRVCLLVVIDLPQENTQSLILSPLANKAILK